MIENQSRDYATLGRSIELPKYPTPKDKEVYAAAISTAFSLDFP